MNEQQVRSAIRKAIGLKAQQTWAEENRINRTVLSDVLRGAIPPTRQICEAIGIQKTSFTTARYERIK